MSKPNRDITGLLDYVVELAKQTSDAVQPIIDAQRDITKTIISLASASLVFTITFSPSLIKQDTPGFWRYAVLACWLLFVLTLLTSLASLYCSMNAGSLPAMFMSNTRKFEDAVEETISTPGQDAEPIVRVITESQEHINKRLKVSRGFFIASLSCFGVALLFFTAIGVRQLLQIPPPTH